MSGAALGGGDVAPVVIPNTAVAPPREPERNYAPLPPAPIPSPGPGGDASGRDTVSSNDWRELAAVAARIPIAFGRVKVSPPCVYLGTDNVTLNTALIRVGKFGVVWSEGPIDSIESWASSKSSATDALGTLAQAGAGIPGAGPMPGIAHSLVIGAALNPQYPTAIVKGRKLFDPRLGAWTSGDYASSAYCAWSANPALIAADLLTSTQYGLAVPPTAVDWTAVAAAADYCDAIVDGVKRWEAHLYVREERSLWEWMETILLHFGGFWRESLGLWTLDYHRGLSTPDLYVTDDLLVRGVLPRISEGSGSGLADVPNRVTVEWTDPATWLTRSVQVHAAEVDAGAAVREGDPYKLHGLQNEKAAQRAASRILALLNGTRSLEVSLMPSAVGLGLGALLDVTLPSLGLSGSRWVITSVLENDDGTLAVVAQEHDTSAFTATGTGDTLPGTGFFDTPPALAGASLKCRVDVTVEGRTTRTRQRPGVIYDRPAWDFAKQLRLRCAVAGQNMVGTVAGIAVKQGGSGYAVNDTVTISGEGSGATAKVSAVSSGAITGVTVLTAGSGYWPQTSAATAGGSGSGAVLAVSISATNNPSTLTWDSPDLARNEYVLPILGTDMQSDATKAWAVVEGLVAAFDDTTEGDYFSGGMISGGSYPMRMLVRLESLAGLLGPASTFDNAGSSYYSTPTNPTRPVTQFSDLTANTIPKMQTTGGERAVDSKLVDTGSDLLYDGVSLLAGGGKVLRAQDFSVGTTNWTCPAGVTEAWFTGCAAGGGGGGRWTGGSGGGGAGGGGGGASVYRRRLAVTPGTVYAVVVGAGGARGNNNSVAANTTNGSTGGTTSFGALLSLAGGAGGARAFDTNGGIGGAAGGPGGERGGDGWIYSSTYSAQPLPGRGGASFPGAFGRGGDGSGAIGGWEAGRDGYALLEWNE